MTLSRSCVWHWGQLWSQTHVGLDAHAASHWLRNLRQATSALEPEFCHPCDRGCWLLPWRVVVRMKSSKEVAQCLGATRHSPVHSLSSPVCSPQEVHNDDSYRLVMNSFCNDYCNVRVDFMSINWLGSQSWGHTRWYLMFRQKEDIVYDCNSHQLLASPEGILVSGDTGRTISRPRRRTRRSELINTTLQLKQCWSHLLKWGKCFIGPLFTMVKEWKQPKCSPAVEWIKRMGYISIV